MHKKINGMPVDALEYWTWQALAEAPEVGLAGCGAIAQALGLAGPLSVRLALTRLVDKGLVYEHGGACAVVTPGNC